MAINHQNIRTAIVNALPPGISDHGTLPRARDIYIPPGHARALRLECKLVVGASGVGKSFWTAVLGDSSLRSILAREVNKLEQADVFIGFGVKPDIEAYPDRNTFSELMVSGHSPYAIWTSVVLRWLSGAGGVQVPKTSWNDSVVWVNENPEQIATLMQHADTGFHNNNRFGLVVFDALERSSNVWADMDNIVRELLRVVLWLQSFRHIHAKVFLREDQARRSITNFPDASRILATQADLGWDIHDLHGLLWHTLCNAEAADGKTLRSFYFAVREHKFESMKLDAFLDFTNLQFEKALHSALQLVDEPIYPFLRNIKRNKDIQQTLFEALAGPWMRQVPNSGVPYSWLVTQLADGRGRTSPRSFLAAIRQAAELSFEQYPAHPFPLHTESIRYGTQNAAVVRIAEIAEDYPWVTEVMPALKGMTVPCEFSEILNQWRKLPVPGLFANNPAGLPPQHADQGWEGVRKDLVHIGIFRNLLDGRVHLPDLFRVGFGLGRFGGVIPGR